MKCRNILMLLILSLCFFIVGCNNSNQNTNQSSTSTPHSKPASIHYTATVTYVFNDFNISTSTFSITSEQLSDKPYITSQLKLPSEYVRVDDEIYLTKTDSTSNKKYYRLGCVARNSKTQVDESFNILVDIQNFPGNSGSPIITRPEIVAIEGTKALNKSVLLGIVHSYFPYQEELLNTQTKKIVEIRSENSGIALVHPVEYIREVIDLIQPPYISKTKEKNE